MKEDFYLYREECEDKPDYLWVPSMLGKGGWDVHEDKTTIVTWDQRTTLNPAPYGK